MRALLTALSIHREMYTAPRSYALWLLFNPLDLAIFLGVPGLGGGAPAPWGGPLGTGSLAASLDRFRLGGLRRGGDLLALGVTRGEVGRLWIPLMPLLLVASLAGPEAPDRRESLLHGTLLAALTLALGAYWVT